ncbi:MAG: hypothetical protein KDA70_10840 [Planctomycetaceae bacterium]|nr:hypothetical protein [Planctomycetaceae bacterium]
MKKRHIFIILGLLTLSLGYVSVTALQETRQEVFLSVAKNKLKQLSLGFDNYESLKENSVFTDAIDHNRSWRVLMSETFADDFLQEKSDDILNQPTPVHFRDPEMSGIFRNDKSEASTLTSFRAIRIKTPYEDVKGKTSDWVVAFLPMDRDDWTSQETLSEADFRKILSRQDQSKTPVYLVTEAGNVMKAGLFMAKREPLKN